MKNTLNKYKIDWDSDDNKEAVRNFNVNRVIVRLFKERHPKIVKKIEKLVEDRLGET